MAGNPIPEQPRRVLLSFAQTHYDVVMMQGLLYIVCIVYVPGTVHIRTVDPYMHALTRDHYCTSCTDITRRVYETLQREQNGRLSWLGPGKLITLLTFLRLEWWVG